MNVFMKIYQWFEGGDMEPETKAEIQQAIRDGSITKEMLRDALRSQDDLERTDEEIENAVEKLFS